MSVSSDHCPGRLLPPMERREEEDASQLCKRTQISLREELKLQRAEFTLDDITSWIEGGVCVYVCGSGLNSLYYTDRKKKSLPLPTSESQSPSHVSTPAPPTYQVPDGIEVMVKQVSTVMPQVPHTTIRNDLCKF